MFSTPFTFHRHSKSSEQRAGRRFAQAAALMSLCMLSGCFSLSGQWEGDLVTEAINVKLLMNVDEQPGGTLTGDWQFLGDQDQVLNSGDLTGTVSGPFVTFNLMHSAGADTLEGVVDEIGYSISGQYNPDSVAGGFEVIRQ